MTKKRKQVAISPEPNKNLGGQSNDKIKSSLESERSVKFNIHRCDCLASLGGAAGSLKEPLSWKDTRDMAREDHLDNI